MSVLDDLKMIHDRDAQDALGIAEKQWQQALQIYDVGSESGGTITSVVVGGMGGSALAAEYIKSWPGTNVPYVIVRDYHLPGWLGPGTLFIASSYSGNTEETLSALAEAEQAGCQIAVIAAGGKLAEIAREKGYPLCEVPEGYQPRMTAMYNLAALVQLLEPRGVVPSGSLDELHTGAEWLKSEVAQWRADVVATSNLAKQLAQELMGSSPVIYASALMQPVGYKWKISLNENAKNVAWYNVFPEFNHNEFLGWTSHPIDKPYKIVDLRSNLDHPQIQKRFELSARMLSGKRPEPHVVNLEGDTLLKQLLWGTAFGDFVSLYVALLNGLNPTPVEIIEKFKKELG